MAVLGTLMTIPRVHSLGVQAGLVRKGREWKRFKSGPRSWVCVVVHACNLSAWEAGTKG